MGLNNFKYLGDFKNECIHCGAIVDSGIINLIKHEDKCEETKKSRTISPFDKTINDILEEVSKETKGSGRFSYETDGHVEKVTTNDFTVWQPHGIHDKVMKEMIAEETIILKGRSGNPIIGIKDNRSRRERRKDKKKNG